jgi:hypothetical protein
MRIADAVEELPPLRRRSRPEVQAIIDAIQHEQAAEKRAKIARGKYEFPPVRVNRSEPERGADAVNDFVDRMTVVVGVALAIAALDKC